MFGWLRRWFGGGSPGLIQQARSIDPQEREQAAVQLGNVPEPWAGEQLLELLPDGYSAVREAAMKSLRQHGQAALPALLTGLNHANAEVGRSSARLLAELQNPDSVDPLLRALKYNARPVQIEARRALESLGSLAVPALEAARLDPQPWVQQQIEEILRTIREREEIHGSQKEQ
jgi:HEAT repeat protein